MLKKIALLLLPAVFYSFGARSQCMPMNVTPHTYSLPCGVNCTNLSFKVMDLRQTTDYQVVSVPYAPFAYTTPGGNALTSLYSDDVFSAALPIPFQFCFFGQKYSQCVVGSNCIITFDLANQATCANSWRLRTTTGSVPVPAPFAGGTICSSSNPYYPKLSIMGPYHDVNPASSPADKKIEWRVEGTAPCRRFIASFYHIGMFDDAGQINTSQMVLHEATGIIDVFMENKPIVSAASNWNGQLAILGIQNEARDNAITAAGKNCTIWTSQNEGYRFLPSGGSSLLQGVQIVRGGTVIGTGTIGSSANGETTVTFPNYCATSNKDTLEIRAIYQSCADPNETIYGLDTIYIVKNPGDLLATATPAPATCTASNGSITVNVPAGAGTPPYTYQLGSGLPQTSNVFTGLASGSYTVTVRDALNTCTSTITVIVGITNPLTVTGAATPTSCPGVSNGTITVTPASGTGPYTYSLNSGTPQLSNVFSGLAAGTYSVSVTDANGCSRATFVTVGNGAGLTANFVPVATACPGVNSGSITVNPTNGTAPYTYTLNSGTPQSSNVFSGLAAGTYSITIRDNNGCFTTFNNIVVGAGTGLTASFLPVATACPGVSSGSITVNPTNGTSPYTYTLGSGTPQSSNVFSGLAAGTYSITIRDNNGCTTTFNNISVGTGTGLTASFLPVATACPGVSSGSITVNPTNGTSPYTYTLGSGTPQSSNVFSGLAAGTYSITIRDNNGCTSTFNNISVGAGAGLTASFVPTAASCAAATNGAITATPTNGTSPYTYTLGSGTPQSSNVFTGLAPGTYSVTIRDNNGCTTTFNNIIVGAGAGISATSATTPASCAGIANGSITVTASSGATPYQYQLGSGAFQPSNNFTGLLSGPYTVTVKDANNCSTTINVTVPANPGVAATASQTPTTCAAASNGTVTVNVTAGVSPYQYQLDAGAFQSPNTFTGVSSGNHTVTIRDNAGCLATVPVTVGVGAGISATATPTATSCNGAANGTISVTASNGSAPYQYKLDAGAFQPSNTFSGVSSGSHTIIVQDANNCTVSVNVTVAQGPALTGTAATTDISCAGLADGSVTITPTSGGPGYQYQLNAGPLQASPTFNGLAAGNYTVTIRDANNCTGTVTFTITAPTPLVISTALTPVLCNGQSNGTVTISGSGGTPPYAYSFNNGAYQPGNTFNTAAGTFNVSVRDANNCVQSASVTVTQPAALTISATASNASCNGGADGVVTATANGGNGGLQYSINNGPYQSANTFNVVPGNYTVTVKDANSCTASTSVTVGLTNNLVLFTRSDTTICESQTVVLTTTGNALSYAWTPGGTLSDSLTQNPVARPPVTTQYIVTGTLGQCTGKDTVVVTVNPAPIPDAGAGTTICYGKTYQLQGSGGVTFSWRPASLLSNPNISNPVANPRGTTVFYLRVTDANGCRSLIEDTAKIIVTPPIVAYAGPDTTITYGEPYQLNVTTQTTLSAGTSYIWSPGIGLDNPNSQTPKATLFADQVYAVDITTPEGCKGSATVTLRVYKGPEIYVPTGFTPNGDGRNDVFYVVPVGVKYFDYLRIYNRWGQLVFETQVAAKGWEGKFRSLDQPSGAYVYMVQGRTDKGKVIFKRGSLLLIR